MDSLVQVGVRVLDTMFFLGVVGFDRGPGADRGYGQAALTESDDLTM